MSPGSRRSDQTRRQFLGTLGAAAAFVSLPSLSLSGPDHVTPLVDDQFGLTGFSPLSDAVSHSRDRYSFHVPYGEDDREVVEDWIASHDDRAELAWNDPIRTATIIMPPDHVREAVSTSWFDSSRLVDQNIEMRIAGGIDLEAEPDWNAAPSTGLGQWVMRALDGSPPESEGIAFDDVETATTEDAREVCGAGDGTVWDDADTSAITVGIIDTGCNFADGRIYTDADTRVLDASKDFTTADEPTVGDEGLSTVADGNGHGSHVTADICANPESADDSEYIGMAPDSDILVLRALDDDGGGSTADIARAVTHGTDEGADVLCMSLGSPLYSEEVSRAIDYAVDEGVVVCVAAGNDGSTPNPFLNAPATHERTIAVAASETAAPEDARTASFSSRSPAPGTLDLSDGETAGADLTITAPGMESENLVADRSGSTSTEALSGTSMACPKVAGAAAVLLAETTVEPEDVGDRLTDYAAPVPNQGIHEAGTGMLDLDAAASEIEPDETQEQARTDEAEARDEGWDALSSAYGRRVVRALTSL